jgi:tetratricopeptide (TPR) repeat protein
VRTLGRIIAQLLALALVGIGVGVLAVDRVAPELATRLRAVPLLANAPFTPVGVGALAAGIGLAIAGAVSARRARGRAEKAHGGDESSAMEARVDEVDPTTLLSRKDLKRYRKEAEAIEAREGADAAGRYLLLHNLRDEAAELFERHELFDRAAEVRHDQNRFLEAAELNEKAGKREAAGAIYAQIGRFEDAARCYREAGKGSVAAEMFDRAGNHREAGRCYREIGFYRQAAQAYLRVGAEASAAECLVAAFTEEGGGAAATNENKARELRAMARKAGEILEKLERFEEAESILVRARAFGPAAKIAYRMGAYDRAAELFLRVSRGDLAAKALTRAGDEIGAARVMGEYLREKGEDAQAVAFLVTAGEYGAAGDLYRRLERYEDAGDCYERAEDFPAAAEMFRAAGRYDRSGEAFARCGEYKRAAECFGQAKEPLRQAAMFEKAGELFAAGRLYADHGEPDDAIRLLQQIEPGEPDFGEACSILGCLFETKGMHTLSIKKFEEAGGAAPPTKSTVHACYELGRALERRGDLERAIEIYDRVLSFDYHFKDVAARADKAKRMLQERRDPVASATPGTSSSGGPTTSVKPGRYQLERELGRGGMGVVYLARDTVLEREVAYKVLPEGLRENPNALRNFLREAKAAAQLNHPNIVTIYDAGESEHGFYLAMEYVDGTTLKEILRRRGAVPAPAVIYILRQMAEALSYAHGKKVVHRDIKTANTMWTRDKQVKIMDFGLAKLMEEVRQATTLVSGTPFYMSPEQTLGRNVDHRTDIYSLGVALFELATGSLPFRKGNVPYHHVHTPAPDPLTVNPDLPSALAKIVLRCLEKDPAARYQTARELIDEVDRLTTGSAGS